MRVGPLIVYIRYRETRPTFGVYGGPAKREKYFSAARLQVRIETPTPGIDLGEWTVRTARIHVLGGNAVLGARQLGDWLSGLEGMTPASLDRVMQI